MSGLEVIGAAASIIQIADAGLKLYNYIESVAEADKRLKRVSKNLETTCNVVREIGEIFQQHETAKLVSKRAVKTACDAADECQEVFDELQVAITKSKKYKFLFPLKEEKLEVLAAQLEKLKSTLSLLMNLLIHAGVLQKHESIAEREKVLELKRARDVATIIYEDRRQIYDRLLQQLPSGPAPPLGGKPVTPIIQGPRSMNFATASLDVGTPAQTSNHGCVSDTEAFAQETLEQCISQISKLLEGIKGIKEAVNDAQAAIEAKVQAHAVYLDVRTRLDSLLVDAEFHTRTPRSALGDLAVAETLRSVDKNSKLLSPPVHGRGPSDEEHRQDWHRMQDRDRLRDRDRIRAGYTHVPSPHPSRSAPDLLSPDFLSSRMRSRSAGHQPAPNVNVYPSRHQNDERSSSSSQERYFQSDNELDLPDSRLEWRIQDQQRMRREELYREKEELLRLRAELQREEDERRSMDDSDEEYPSRLQVDEMKNAFQRKYYNEREAKQLADWKKLDEGIQKRRNKFGSQEPHIGTSRDLERVTRQPRDTLLTKRIPTYVKVHVADINKHTLEYFGLPWEYDINNSNYYIILQEMNPDEMDILFAHTREQRREKTRSITESYGLQAVGPKLNFRKESTSHGRSTWGDSDSSEVEPISQSSDTQLPSLEREYTRARPSLISSAQWGMRLDSPPVSDLGGNIDGPDEVDELLHEWTTLFGDEEA